MLKIGVISLLIVFSMEAVRTKKNTDYLRLMVAALSLIFCISLLSFVEQFLIKICFFNAMIFFIDLFLFEKKSKKALEVAIVSNLIILPGFILKQIYHGSLEQQGGVVSIFIIGLCGTFLLKSPMIKRMIEQDEENKQSLLIFCEIVLLIIYTIQFLVDSYRFPMTTQMMLHFFSLCVYMVSLLYLFHFSKQNHYYRLKKKYTRALMGEFESNKKPMYELIQNKEKILFDEVERLSELIKEGVVDIQDHLMMIKEKSFIQIRFTENQLLNTMLFSYYIDFESRGFLFEANFPYELKDEEKLASYFDYIMLIFDYFDGIINNPDIYRMRQERSELVSIHMIWNHTSYRLIGSISGKICNFLLAEEEFKSKKQQLKRQHLLTQLHLNISTNLLEIEIFQATFRKGSKS